jgi:hypothetical protein
MNSDSKNSFIVSELKMTGDYFVISRSEVRIPLLALSKLLIF